MITIHFTCFAIDTNNCSQQERIFCCCFSHTFCCYLLIIIVRKNCFWNFFRFLFFSNLFLYYAKRNGKTENKRNYINSSDRRFISKKIVFCLASSCIRFFLFRFSICFCPNVFNNKLTYFSCIRLNIVYYWRKTAMKHKITELLSSIRFQIQLEPKYAICPFSNSLRFHVRFPRRTIRVRSCEVKLRFSLSCTNL